LSRPVSNYSVGIFDYSDAAALLKDLRIFDILFMIRSQPLMLWRFLRCSGLLYKIQVLLSASNIKLANNKKLSVSTKIEHYYLLGKPIKRPATPSIVPPYSKNKRFLISQGFNGQYSHTWQGNRYALDIAMPIGEQVLTVAEGIVADARDDFSIGGADYYFLDKANHVTVMHADGSYAIYVHILYGSLAVAVGQKIEVGQVLTRIGNAGYSTVPHLHFVMRYNSGRGGYSFPFKFITHQGAKQPKKGKYYSGR
jgi:murein DD-endopeptidase MepM/ murein hydrolase activator NlpD